MPDEAETSQYIWDRYLLPFLSNEKRNTWLETVDSDDFNDIQYNTNTPHRNTLAIGEKCQFLKKTPLIVRQSGSLEWLLLWSCVGQRGTVVSASDS